MGPVQQSAEHVAEIAEIDLGVEPVESCRGDRGHEVAGGLRVVVGADEHPGVAADGNRPQRALGGVAVEAQPAIVVEASELTPLTMGIAQRSSDKSALPTNLLVLGVNPLEERVGVCTQVEVAMRLDLGGRLAEQRSIELEDPVAAREALPRERCAQQPTSSRSARSASAPSSGGGRCVGGRNSTSWTLLASAWPLPENPRNSPATAALVSFAVYSKNT